MAEIDAQLVKSLRDKTSAGMMDCRKALIEAKGNFEEAEKVLRTRLNLSAAKKADRETNEGAIASYIHAGGKVGVLIEVNCETDFVAKNDLFKELVKDLSLHIAAANPKYVSKDLIPADVLAAEKDQDAFVAANSLLDQPFVKDQNKLVRELLTNTIGTLGENITVKRFARFAIGE